LSGDVTHQAATRRGIVLRTRDKTAGRRRAVPTSPHLRPRWLLETAAPHHASMPGRAATASLGPSHHRSSSPVSRNAMLPRPLPSANRRPYSVLSPCSGPPTSSRVTVFTAEPPSFSSDSTAGESPSTPPHTLVADRLTPLHSPRRSPPSIATRSSLAACSS
jgi:hypothetical protein